MGVQANPELHNLLNFWKRISDLPNLDPGNCYEMHNQCSSAADVSEFSYSIIRVLCSVDQNSISSHNVIGFRALYAGKNRIFTLD